MTLATLLRTPCFGQRICRRGREGINGANTYRRRRDREIIRNIPTLSPIEGDDYRNRQSYEWLARIIDGR